MSINNVCDYVITSLADSGEALSNLKLQKLLFYIQAWHLAFYNGKPFFDGKFEAWVHGPVSRQIYDRFLPTKSLYSDIGLEDRQPGFSPSALSEAERRHVDTILSAYAKYSGPQLEELTHNEEPWNEARAHHEPWERCSNIISEETMKNCYAARLK